MSYNIYSRDFNKPSRYDDHPETSNCVKIIEHKIEIKDTSLKIKYK